MSHKSHVVTVVIPVVLDQVADELGFPGSTAEWEGALMCAHGKGASGRILVSNVRVEVYVHARFAMIMFREPIRASIDGSIVA